jgi:stage 0 sporulation protein B (sporulation initiation phosphotransferase)
MKLERKDPSHNNPSIDEFLHDLRQYRHDFMNDIQLLKGYLALGNMDELRKSLDQIVISAQQESYISQIGDPDLAYFILTYNWKQDKLHLEVEVDMAVGHISSVGVKHPHLYTFLRHTLAMLEKGCQNQRNNHVFILFQGHSARLNIFLDYEGSWDPYAGKDCLQEIQATTERNQGKLRREHVRQEELMLNIELRL